MSQIIRAIVLTNSSEDSLARVKVKSEDVWKESPLIPSVNGIALKKDDVVYVDVSEGYENPLIIGRSVDNSYKFEHSIDGTVLFESSNGNSWSIAYVKNNKLEFYNSDKVSVVVDGSKIEVVATKVTVKSDIEFTKTLKGTSPSMASKTAKGFCVIPVCPFSGVMHLTDEI